MSVTREELGARATQGQVAVRCPVCGSAEFDALLEPADIEAQSRWLRAFFRDQACDLEDHAKFTHSEPTHVVACRVCGTVIRNPRPNSGDVALRYEGDRYGRATLHQMLDGQRAFFVEKAGRFDLPVGARVLEIGCFVGAFLLAARARDWDAVGLDVGEETSAFCRDLGFEVYSDPGDPGLGNGFDAVFIWNTFDQLSHPREELRWVRRVLRPGGVLVLRVPNGRFLVAALDLWRARASERIFEAMAYNNFLTFPYLTGYTPDSIKRLLGQEGYQVRHVRGDTLVSLADPCTPPDNARREVLVKRATMRACELREGSWPWMDVLAQTVAASLE